MKFPHLKTKKTDPQQFGILVEPEVDVYCDEELYEAVEKHGHAKVRILDVKKLNLEAKPVTLTPAKFKNTWIGD